MFDVEQLQELILLRDNLKKKYAALQGLQFELQQVIQGVDYLVNAAQHSILNPSLTEDLEEEFDDD